MSSDANIPAPALPPLAPGTLYLVATPIGNMEDITLRAIRTLRECDLVAAEDTRRTGHLLRHFDINRRMVSCFAHNERRRSEEILRLLQSGGKVALVSDAGTPGISDPGARLVRGAIDAGLRVESVPGPCALVAGLVASGLPTDEFHFVGFLPNKSGQRARELDRLLALPGTLVLYESPYRVEKLLGELVVKAPARQVVLAREMSKRHEEYLRGLPAELARVWSERPRKGEFVVMIDGGDGLAAEVPPAPAEQEPA
ncbi:MAG: 16S rRNA (cytidine(1402)-2'-O)-methyltransferase [Verrucomicrobia bacterium]|nr:16S rRNA (cytidine(1402)-2'-O)-methyltransferase [Verrucomicrobiota bacterium]MBI3870351.1 16S rRNA (cytidine(1402)-2'-O)-methyltransferase [Verrucomicrobiota bacterium]